MYLYILILVYLSVNKIVVNHTAHAIFLRPSLKQWLMNYIFDLIMMIRWSTYKIKTGDHYEFCFGHFMFSPLSHVENTFSWIPPGYGIYEHNMTEALQITFNQHRPFWWLGTVKYEAICRQWLPSSNIYTDLRTHASLARWLIISSNDDISSPQLK